MTETRKLFILATIPPQQSLKRFLTLKRYDRADIMIRSTK